VTWQQAEQLRTKSERFDCGSVQDGGQAIGTLVQTLRIIRSEQANVEVYIIAQMPAVVESRIASNIRKMSSSRDPQQGPMHSDLKQVSFSSLSSSSNLQHVER